MTKPIYSSPETRVRVKFARRTTNPKLVLQLLNGEVKVEDLPPDCIFWTGRRSKARQVRRYDMTSEGPVLSASYMTPPRGMLQENGRTVHVHRWLYAKVKDLPEGVMLYSGCPDPYCINPNHWTPKNPRRPIDEASVGADDWDMSDVEELVEGYIGRGEPMPVNRSHILFEDVPPVMLEAAIAKLGRK